LRENDSCGDNFEHELCSRSRAYRQPPDFSCHGVDSEYSIDDAEGGKNMRFRIHLVIMFIVLGALFLIFPQVAYGSSGTGMLDRTTCSYYIDIGTGSIMIQVLIGSFVGLMAVLGVYRMRVKAFFTNLFSRHRQHDDSSESEESGEND
jgi:hypothetical protein